MKTMWKNVLGVVLVAAISTGAAVGTSAYLMNKKQPVYVTDSTNTFNQPIRYAGLNVVAAENTDFTQAAESTVHGVVHIKATTNAKQYADDGRGQQQYVDPFEYFFGFGGRGGGGFQRPQPQPRVGSGSGVIIPQMDILSQITM